MVDVGEIQPGIVAHFEVISVARHRAKIPFPSDVVGSRRQPHGHPPPLAAIHHARQINPRRHAR